ncbi:MAG: TSUP family transporter [Gemmatimonadales bacterium]
MRGRPVPPDPAAIRLEARPARGGRLIERLLIGFVTNFFDTLGIGSFATTTAAFRARHLVRDEVIPGTLNVGHTPPTIVQAIIYITVIAVDRATLVLLIGASVVGAWLGAGVVSRWERRRVQRGMAAALVVTAAFIVLRMTGIFPGGGDALGLRGTLLVLGVLGNALLGALMTLGIGLYAPCMAMISLLGMNPVTAFPVMMGSCAFLMPVASVRFLKAGRYDRLAVIGLAIGGIPGVLLAAFLVKSLPLDAVRVLVVIVIGYTAATLWRDSRRESALVRPPSPPVPDVA